MSPGDDPLFLSVEEVLEIQLQMLETHGGQPGIRDRSSLESAVGMPTQTFDGEFVHVGLFEMGAAYAFHIAENQPFVGWQQAHGPGGGAHLPSPQWHFDRGPNRTPLHSHDRTRDSSTGQARTGEGPERAR